MSTDDVVGTHHAPASGRAHVREALTMALYVAVCLVAALAALPEAAGDHVPLLGLVWGVPLGLALAHLFAFRVSARLGGADTGKHEIASMAAQLAGSAAVGLLGTVVVVLTPAGAERAVVSGALAASIGLVGYAVVRGGGESRPRAAAYAIAVSAVALAVVAVKNALAGH